MPEYLAPGVYVEETSFRQKTIEGVSTSTAGFIGPTRFGPIAGEAELLTSFLDFERIYGGIEPLDHDGASVPNDVANGVRGFFENGGRRLYVARAYVGDGGHASASLPDSGSAQMAVRARHPGAAANVLVTFAFRAGQNVLVPAGTGADPSPAFTSLSGVTEFDTVLVVESAAPRLAWLESHRDPVVGETFRLRTPGDPADGRLASDLPPDSAVHVLTVTVTVGAMGAFMDEQVWDDLTPDPRHRRDALLTVFAAEPTRRATELFTPIVVAPGEGAALGDGVAVVTALLGAAPQDSTPLSAAELVRDAFVPLPSSPPTPPPPPTPLMVGVDLEGGSDGARPGVAEYEGDVDDANRKSGLLAFEDLEDISIVAAPGSSRGGLNGRGTEMAGIQQLLLSHCERMRYRVAVLDAPDGALVSEARTHRAGMDSTHGALYYPWITIVDPLTREEVTTPPSGFVAGIYARNDVEQGVHRSPANEVVRLAISFEHLLNKAQQDVLNPEGVNCLRSFEGRGLRVWGARCITSDPEWKYLALRRYFAYLARSIELGTQWAVFEPNGRVLWSRVRRTVEDFLLNEFRSSHLMGETPEEAFFVRCDRTTMTQNDFDNGRLICLIGVAPLRPAEFVIFRIGQKTLDSRG